MTSAADVSIQDAATQRLTPDFDKPVVYRAYSHFDYRPCDVAEGQARVCEVLAGGALTASVQKCASLCTCLSQEVQGVDCNAVTWQWRVRDGNNCFPKFIEGLEARDGTRPPDACAYSSESSTGAAHTLLVMEDLDHGTFRCQRHGRSHVPLHSFMGIRIPHQ